MERKTVGDSCGDAATAVAVAACGSHQKWQLKMKIIGLLDARVIKIANSQKEPKNITQKCRKLS